MTGKVEMRPVSKDQNPKSMPVFTPTGNQPLLVRGTIGGPFDAPVKHLKSTTHDRHQYKRPTPSPAHSWPASRPATSPGSRFGELSRSSFFSRHNPHPVRVRHIKGLNDIPICAVHDTGFVSSPRWNLSTPGTAQRERIFKHHMPVNAIGINSTKFPINTVTGLQNFPFKEKAIPRIGLVPVASLNNSWRDELKDIVEKAGLAPPTEQELKDRDLLPKRQTKYSEETGRLIPPPSRAMSRQASRQGSRQGGRYNHFMHISPDPNAEVLVLEMLCQILQTDSIQAVQQWLVNATGREKDLVLDMIKSAILSEEEYYKHHVNPEFYPEEKRPYTSDRDANYTRYSWSAGGDMSKFATDVRRSAGGPIAEEDPVEAGRQSHPPEVLRIDSPHEGQTAPPVKIPPAHLTPSPPKTSPSRQAQSATTKMEAPEQPKLRYTKTPTSRGGAEPPADNMQ
ncbi:PREDICTED: protein TBATA-like isoform X1 [Branchiostoma belcheri]|uniref:Protein TBATA-like isoform X1 n=2 Tax=Branchiostoma belcheri TaxID=7741 RepID=A0A6P4YRW9_BRABE|nr:PREDICTED: protein TBATA-like isoform X1 [Branchiostoma belcheri]